MTNFTHIASFNYPSDLAIVRTKLEAEGIKCWVNDELTVQIDPLVSNAIGGIRLGVPEDRAAEAIKFMEELGFSEYLFNRDLSEKQAEDKRNIKLIKGIFYALVVVGVLAIIVTLIYAFIGD